MRQKKLVVPYSAADAASEALDSLLSTYPEGGEVEEPEQDNEPEEELEDEPEVEEGDVDDAPPAEEPKKNNQLSNDTRRANDQFAKMRIANRELTQLLGKLAKANGIEYSSTDELISKLNDSALQQISQRSNVPVELLKEVESLRADSEMLRQQHAQARLTEGFRVLLTDYGLSEKELREYCAELDGSGVDISAHGFDLVNHYKSTHIDDIVTRRVQAEVAKALSKDAASDAHSTSPVQKRGSRSGSTTKVSTMAGLEALLKDFPDTK